MLPELGHFALIVALMLALVLGTLPLVGAQRGAQAWMALARPAALAQFVFVALAFASLMASFANNDFSVINVASNSNSELPLAYRLAATWGSHEGSMLLWVLMLTGWTAAVAAGPTGPAPPAIPSGKRRRTCWRCWTIWVWTAWP